MDKTIWLVLALLMIGGIFAVDLALPLGVAVWLLYMLPLLFSLWFLQPAVTILLTAASSVLILIGFANMGEPLIHPEIALLNRLMVIGILWVTVSIGLRYKGALKEIRRLADDLTLQAADLETANHDLEVFSYSVAHDLRKPLTCILGYCELLHEQCPTIQQTHCGDYLSEIVSGARRMDQTIETLLNLALFARCPLTKEMINLSEIVHDVAADLRLSQPERVVTFDIAENVMANADNRLLRVVLENLLSNAWKYTSSKHETVIEFGVDNSNGKRTYFVRDNGIGFDKSHAGRMFDAFQRLHGSYEGFGIGLAMVERIIDRHGGEIWADAEEGTGATFYFRL